MEHLVLRSAPDRCVVAYMLPGTNVASCVSEYPLGLRSAALDEARRLSVEPPPPLSPEERRIPSGFYADQGNLF